ncbi:hypothetical protein [Rhodohalobacter sp.]|uniref:hypothetical protein n=1 Tax=Rhodohalobacter sp. TaxID=1974210 RepID=UPI002ACDDE8F|nr:hypothetical protein [Rhodohalobacter sp.]MDZ7757277.1 hypothetical protein [Rhodohalobacter sp.]
MEKTTRFYFKEMKTGGSNAGLPSTPLNSGCYPLINSNIGTIGRVNHHFIDNKLEIYETFDFNYSTFLRNLGVESVVAQSGNGILSAGQQIEAAVSAVSEPMRKGAGFWDLIPLAR